MDNWVLDCELSEGSRFAAKKPGFSIVVQRSVRNRHDFSVTCEPAIRKTGFLAFKLFDDQIQDNCDEFSGNSFAVPDEILI